METCYWRADASFSRLGGGGLRKAGELAKWRQSLMRGWSQLKILGVESCGGDSVHVGSELQVKAKVNLGPLKPDDVQVQLFYGLVDSLGEIPAPQTAVMGTNSRPAKEGEHWLC